MNTDTQNIIDQIKQENELFESISTATFKKYESPINNTNIIISMIPKKSYVAVCDGNNIIQVIPFI